MPQAQGTFEVKIAPLPADDATTNKESIIDHRKMRPPDRGSATANWISRTGQNNG